MSRSPPRPDSSHSLRSLLACAILLGLATATPVSALDPLRSPQEYAFDQWTLESEAPVRALAQDTDGYLWIGTPSGLVRFDGITFTHFGSAEVPALRNQAISALALAADGTLWVGTEGSGIARLRNGRWTALDLPAKAMVSPVRCFWAESDGSMLVALHEQVWRYHDGTFTELVPPANLRFAGVRQIVRTGEALWIAGYRIMELRGDTSLRHSQADGLPHHRGHSIVPAPEGGVWIGTPNGAARFAQGRTAKTLTTEDGLPAGAVEALLVDRDGALWLATAAGLGRYHAGRCELFATRTGEPLTDLWCLFEDRDGNLWIGGSGGIARLKNIAATTLTRREGLPGEPTCLLETADGTRWVGTRGGVWRSRDGHSTVLRVSNGLPEDSLTVLAEGPDGAVWMAHASSGLGVYRTDSNSYHAIAPPGDSGRVRTIAIGRNGEIWLGFLSKGLNRYENGRFTEIPLDGLGQGIRLLFVDSRNRLWVGGKRGALGVLDDGRWRLRVSPSGEDARIGNSGICEDTQGAIWVTSNEAPLLRRLTDDSIAEVPLPPAVGGELFAALIEQDNLWVNSTRGVLRLRLAECRASLADRTAPPTIERVGDPDELRLGRPSYGGWPNSRRMRDGSLWFTNRTGVAVVDRPERQAPPPSLPKPLIEQVQVDGKPVEMGPELRLPAGTRRIVVRYTCLMLGATEHLRFRHQLVGFEEKETEVGNERIAQYTNLSTGHYVFRVWAQLEGGGSAAGPTELAFSIAPHFWQTRWFLLLCLAAAGGALFGADRLRLRAARRREARLHRRVEEEMAKVKVLTGLLPTCAWCHKIRDEKGEWQPMEHYIVRHSHAQFTHGMCPKCAEKFNRDFPG